MPSKSRKNKAEDLLVTTTAETPETAFAPEVAVATFNKATENMEVRFPGHPGSKYTGALSFLGGKWDADEKFWYGNGHADTPLGGKFGEAAVVVATEFNANIASWQKRQAYLAARQEGRTSTGSRAS